MRRLQRRIAEGTVPEQSVAAYFADISEIPAKLQPLEIDLFGNIQNWPKDFFGDEMGDVAEHAKAAMKRRIQQGTETSESAE